MKNPYEDMLYLPHHVSPRRARMSLADRAAQFSPFAALSGYDAAIEETARLTESRIFLDVDAQAELNKVLSQVQEQISQQPKVRITYFIPDQRKNGGSYAPAEARVIKISSIHKWLLLDSGERIFFEDILLLKLVPQ